MELTDLLPFWCPLPEKRALLRLPAYGVPLAGEPAAVLRFPAEAGEAARRGFQCRLGEEALYLGIASSPETAPLFAEGAEDLPEAVALALAEATLKPLLTRFEALAGKPLSIEAFGASDAPPEAVAFRIETEAGEALQEGVMTLPPALEEKLLDWRWVDAAAPSLQSLVQSFQLRILAFAPEEAPSEAELRAGDFLLLPEFAAEAPAMECVAEGVEVPLVLRGSLAAATGALEVSEIARREDAEAESGLCVCSMPFEVSFGDVRQCLSSPPLQMNFEGQVLELRAGGRCVARGSLSRVGMQPALKIEGAGQENVES